MNPRNLLKPARWREFTRAQAWRFKLRARAALLRRAKLDRDLKSGVSLRVASLGDWAIYNDVFIEGEYDPAIRAALAGPPGGPVAVLDLGANVGFFALRVAHLAFGAPEPRKNFHITCVEGSPAIHAELCRRIAATPAAAAHIKIVHGLAGQRSGSAHIVEAAFHPMTGLSAAPGRGPAVDFVDLEAVVGGATLDLLKCDIEGAEQAFLENYPGLLARTRFAVVELHHDRCDRARCRELLRDSGLLLQKVLAEDAYTSLEFFARTPAA